MIAALRAFLVAGRVIAVKNLALVLVSVAFAAGLTAGWKTKSLLDSEEIAALKVSVSSMRVESARAALKASERAREKEQTLAAQAEEKIREAQQETIQAHRGYVDARRANDQLRQHFVALIAQLGAAEDAGTAAGGEAASGPGLVLADVYGRTADRATELAEAYDSSRRAGLLCERLYEGAQNELNKD